MRPIYAVILISIIALSTTTAEAAKRDQIRIVGSSTVYPFATVAAEQFGSKTGMKTPVVESTGTGGGFKLFCGGIGENFPDMSNASRAIKQSEIDECAKNGIKAITEEKIGFDGLVIANAKDATAYDLTKEQIFLALGKKVPQNGKLVDNPFQTWNEIDPSLPKAKIEVYGPPPTSGTRDSFNEMVIMQGCEHFKEFEAAYSDKKERDKACQLIREDGKFIEAGENDNLIVQKLTANKNALGIFGFSFLDQNRDKVKGSHISGVEPTFENIASGSYTVSRPLFVYVKNAHVGNVPGIKEFIKELTSEEAIGEEGYLVERGLVPLTGEEFKKVKATADNLQ